MPTSTEKANIATVQVRILPEHKPAFIDWQAKLNALIASFPGFVSLEILSPTGSGKDAWVIVQRFYDERCAQAWSQSPEYLDLSETLKSFTDDHRLEEKVLGDSFPQNAVTEVFITQVSPDKELLYREWISKIHHVEAKFPGFKGVYVQSPAQIQGSNWITFLQFDTPENLDHWLNSPERKAILDESKALIASLESHRVITPYAGWFSSIAKTGKMPSVTKQTMLILLVLFPIVMLELKFLMPYLKGLDISLGTFISNAISVTLISWPMMPLAIKFLKWWLSPIDENDTRITVLGTILVLVLYLIEIAIFWNFF